MLSESKISESTLKCDRIFGKCKKENYQKRNDVKVFSCKNFSIKHHRTCDL